MDVRIQLQPMRQTHEVIEDDDNWTGITDAAGRRRRQNRLNQRARRRRKQLGMELNATPDDETYITAVTTVQRAPNRIYSSMSTTEPLPHPFRFPLSVDHLLTLVQYNVYRGLLTNMVLLALPNMFGCDEAEPPISLSMLPLPAVIPPSLAPTSLQLTVPHEPWVDVFPLPALRDNLIRATGTFDSCELCDDSLGTLFDETLTKHDDRNSVCLWGEPWDVNSWEIMEGFAKKWGGLLVGCTELIAATNRWREIRGERPLRISC